MKYKITDLMDLYEDKGCLLDSLPLEESAGGKGKETIALKERRGRFGWKEALALAAALGAAVLGGLGIRSYLRHSQAPEATQAPTPVITEPLVTDSLRSEPSEPQPEAQENLLDHQRDAVNELLTALAQQGVGQVFPELSGEYELLNFALLYAKTHEPGAVEYREGPQGDSYEVLPLEQINRILNKLLGRSLDPEEDTDYTLLRGENYAQHQFFREGAYWSPAADGDIPTRFALADSAAPGEGKQWTVEFTVYEGNLALWPEFVDTPLTELAGNAESLLAAGKLSLAGKGRAQLLPAGAGLQVLQYNTWAQGSSGDEALLAELKALFSDDSSWYSQALTSRYAAPEQVDLYELFYNGIPEAPAPTPEEEAIEFLMFPSTRYAHTACDRLPRAEMDRVLEQYFGLTLAETDLRRLFPMYVAQTDCWFHEHGDTNAGAKELLALRVLDDGRILFLHDGSGVMTGSRPDTLWTAGLKPVEGGYQMLFNLPGEWTTPEDAGDFYPLNQGDSFWRSIQRDPDGAHVTRELDFAADGTLRWREGDRDSEFSYWAEGSWWLQAGKLHVQFYETDEETDEQGWRNPYRLIREAVFTGGAKGAGGLVLTQESETGFAAAQAGWTLEFTRQPAPVPTVTCTQDGAPVEPGLAAQIQNWNSTLWRILGAGDFDRPQDIRLRLVLTGGLGDSGHLDQEELEALQSLYSTPYLDEYSPRVLWSDLDPLLEQWLGVSRDQLTDWTGLYTLPGRECCYVATVEEFYGLPDLSFRALRDLGEGLYQLEYGRLDQDADKEILWTAMLRQSDKGWQVLSNHIAVWNE